MTIDEVTKYVEAAGLADHLSLTKTQNHIKFSCPFAAWTHRKGTDSNPSFTITTWEDGGASYRCFGCGQKGKLWQMFTTLSIYSGNPAFRKLGEEILAQESRPSTVIDRVMHNMGVPHYVTEKHDMTPLKNWFTKQLPYANVCSRGGKYLVSRGFSSETWHQFGCRWDERDNRVVFPVQSLDKVFVGASGRTLSSDEPKKWKHYWGTRTERGFVMPLVVPHCVPEEYILCEGPFDAMRIWQHLKKMGTDRLVIPLAISGCDISREQIDGIELVQTLTMLMLDNDKAGLKGAAKAKKLLERRIPRCVDLTEKLPSGADPNELSLAQFTGIITK